MSRCRDKTSLRDRFFHYWKAWGNPIQATYRGVETLVQIRHCLYCGKAQVKPL